MERASQEARRCRRTVWRCATTGKRLAPSPTAATCPASSTTAAAGPRGSSVAVKRMWPTAMPAKGQPARGRSSPPSDTNERGRVIDPGSSGQLGAYVAAQDPAAGRDHAAGLDVEREEPVAPGQPGSLRDLSTRAVEEGGALTTEIPAAAATGAVEGGSVRVKPAPICRSRD